jgi:2-methylcitrate dehydratase
LLGYHLSDNLGALLAVGDYLCRAWNDPASEGVVVKGVVPRLITVGSLLEALMKAYEIQGIMLIHNAFNARGLDHVILVKLASAVVVSWLLNLSEDQALAVMSHVFMDNAPLRVYRQGSNTITRKSWAAGDACSRAVYLNLLVAAGQPGASSVLSCPRWGFFDAVWNHNRGDFATHNDREGDERSEPSLGFELPVQPGEWAMRNVFFKLYSVEGHSISAIEACLQQVEKMAALYGAESPIYDRISRVHVRTSHATNMLINKTGPLRNPADRDHCLQYILAVTLIKGKAPVAEDFFDESIFQQTELTNHLRVKITVEEVDDFTRRYHDLDVKALPCGVSISMNDGMHLDEILVEFPIGHVRNQKTECALKEKFWRNMTLLYSAETVRRVEEAIYDQPELPVSQLMDMMAPSSLFNATKL